MSRLTVFRVQVQALPAMRNANGAITVEYALGMMIAGFLMLGIFAMFKNMSIDIISQFKQYVVSFPNI